MNPNLVKSPDALFNQYKVLGMPNEYTKSQCEKMAEEIALIKKLKKEKDAVILAHNYQRPEIFEVADFIGDSLELAQKAKTVENEVIVFCGVHFMAETAKILNPNRKVLLPNLKAGCSLADFADAENLEAKKEELKKVYPDLQVVSYVNTTAAVKAASDICCTSSNAAKIVESLPTNNILFVPDQNLARWVQESTKKNIIAWDGHCYVHHQITPEQISLIRDKMPQVKILVHPECRKDVQTLADAVLSTSGMVRYAKENSAREFLVVTECGLTDRLLIEVPEKKFYKSCKLCSYMKMITLENTRVALQEMQHPIELDEIVRQKAEVALNKMLQISN